MLSACGDGGDDNSATPPPAAETASQGSQIPAKLDSPSTDTDTDKNTYTIQSTPFEIAKLISFEPSQQSANQPLAANEAQDASFTNGNGVFRLPLAGQQTTGNLTISVAVDDPDGISNVLLGFEGSSQALTLCDSDCPSVFTRTVTGVNPLEFGLSSGPLTLMLWATDLNGNKVIIATVNIEWQATAITGITPDRVVNNIALSWNPLSNYLRYNVYIAKQDGVTYQNYQSLEGGEAFLALTDPEIELTGISNNQIISVMVTGVDGSGESAFSDTIKIGALDGSANLAPIAQDDTFSINEDETLNANLISNDSDPENRLLTASTTLILEPRNGVVILNSDGTFSYTPVANFSGRDYFYYAAKDDFSQTDTAAVVINVSAVNDAPAGLFDGFNLLSTAAVASKSGNLVTSGIGVANVSVNGFLEVDAPGLLINDLDIDDTSLTVNTTPVVAATQGTLALNTDGSFRYTPNADASGEDSFTYEVIDGQGAVSQSIVRITTDGASFPPIAANDNYIISQDQTLNANNSSSNNLSLLDNDTDLDPDDSLAVNQVTSLPINGSLIFAVDGTFTYTPDSGYFGVDHFVYQITDNQGNIASAAALITVNRVNQPPIAIADNYEFNEDNSLNVEAIDGLLANDSDQDLDPISITLTPLQGPASGELTLSADGSFDYIPDDNYFGSDSFRYQISDDSGGFTQATVTLTINNVNDDPVAVDDSLQTLENTPVTIDVLNNDSDIEQQSLTVTAAISSNGAVVINSDNTITFTPTSGFLGLVNIDYTIDDGAGGSASAQVILTVNLDNQAPVAIPDSYSLPEDSQLTANNIASLLINDFDNDQDPLSVNTTPQINVTNGILELNSDGRFNYQPNANFFGTDTFNYQINDGNGATSTATVTLLVTPINDAPSAVNDTATSVEDTLVNINVLANDTDVENDSLIITGANAENGSADILSDNTINYSPRADFSGTDILTYSITDSNGGTATALVNVLVIASNDPPVANNDVSSTSEDTAININVLANDSDVDGDTLVVTSATAANGTATNLSDSSIDYQPNSDFSGTDTIVYFISDLNGGSASATVNVTVLAVNDAPITNDDIAVTSEDSVININVLINDTDIDGNTLTITTASASNGAVTIGSDGSLTYLPNMDFSGTDIINYTVSDGNGGSASSTATVTVNQVNDAPLAVNDFSSTDEDFSVAVNVLANDSDVDSNVNTASVTVLTQPINGQTSVNNASGIITYTPVANFNGSDSFTYNINDGVESSDPATVLLTITAINDAPVANDDAAAVDEGNSVTIDVRANDSDEESENSVLTLSNISSPANGTVVDSGNGTLTYTHNGSETSADSFTYTVNDGSVDSNTATVSVNIINTNNAPVFTATPGIGFTGIDIDNDAEHATTVFSIDVDGDGDMDVLSASNNDDTIAWYENDGNVGNPSFTKQVITDQAIGAYSVFAIDVDGDDDIDVLSASYIDDTIAWYENDGNVANPDFTKRVITSDADGVLSVFAIDIDGDGDIDVLSASNFDDTIAWYENDGIVGNPSFTKQVITTTADGAYSVFAIDVDGDLDIDVLSASANDDTIAWYENNGAEGFTEHVITSAADGARSVFAIDVNGDGDIDVLSASLNDDTIAWYENDGAVGNPNFAIRVITSDADGATSVFAIDIDDDGDIDVLSASELDDTIAWYENDAAEGTTGFTKRGITSDVDGASSVFSIDVDGDGDIDVLSASIVDNTIAWYENDDTINFSVPENTTPVGNILATDADGDMITYGISTSADQGLFSIDSTTGALSFITAPNFEVPGSANNDNTYKVTVTASDNGDVVSSEVVIYVTDADDPATISGSSTGEATERNGTQVTGTLIATDEDPDQTGFTAQLSTSGNSGYGTFTLLSNGNWTYDVDNTKSAVLALNDGDTLTDTFTAVSSDGTGSQVVTVTINGQNDAPVFTATAETGIDVPENTEQVGNILATDADGDMITYGISTGADQALFSIDSTTGALSFITAPNFEVPGSATNDNTYNVTITASANGDVVSSAVVINVTDANDPTTISGLSTGEATERSGTQVTGTLIATDEDLGQAGFTAQPSTLGDSGYGTFTLLSNGNWTYDVNNMNSAILALNDGATLTDTFTAVSSDGTSTQVVTVTINGLNSEPFFTATTDINLTGIDIDEIALGATSVFAIDVNGDGHIDVLSASFDDNTIAWYKNNGNMATPSFEKRVIVGDMEGSMDIADGATSVFAIDVNGDGHIDVLSASANDDTIAWYENDGNVANPSFTKRVIVSEADGATSVFAIDVNGDGHIDVLSASAGDSTIAWYENDGVQDTPTFEKRVIVSGIESETNSSMDAAIGATSVFAIDVDGDTDIDVLSASYSDGVIAWYENISIEGSSTQSFTKRLINPFADGASSVFAIDVDDDGDIDVLSASAINNTIAWYENGATENEAIVCDGDSQTCFLKHVIDNKACGATSVFAIDGDGDGDIVVLSASFNDHTIAGYENVSDEGIPSFFKRVITGDAEGDDVAEGDEFAGCPEGPAVVEGVAVAEGARSVFAVDVDGDGDIDVLSASEIDDTIAWYENEGTFNFIVPENTTFVANLLATDADGDEITYGISMSADQALFSIDLTTGDLSFNAPPVFEANGDNTYIITVTASANGQVVSSAVVIDVTGEEEMPPPNELE